MHLDLGGVTCEQARAQPKPTLLVSLRKLKVGNSKSLGHLWGRNPGFLLASVSKQTHPHTLPKWHVRCIFHHGNVFNLKKIPLCRFAVGFCLMCVRISFSFSVSEG